MYIRYLTPQDVADSDYKENKTTSGNYRPTWLIRTEGWKKVPGTEAYEGYHALSYCWEQSGDILEVADGKFIRVDNGQHRHTHVNSARNSRSRHTTFDILLSQICRDFGIKYLWFDMLCVDQTNMAEKEWELTQLPLIYRNARYTLALVPEVRLAHPNDLRVREEIHPSQYMYSRRTLAKVKTVEVALKNSMWGKSSWALVETMNSTQMVIVGYDVHAWFITAKKQSNYMYEQEWFTQWLLGYHSFNLRTINMALHHLHFRTSSTEHDKLFALATSLYDHDIFIDYDYNADSKLIRKDLYTQMATCDLSILFFGSKLDENGNVRATSTMDHYGLPSWTGIEGMHSPYPVFECRVDQGKKHFVDDDMQLHITCRSFTVYASKYDDNYFNDDQRRRRAYKLDKFDISSLEDLVFWDSHVARMSVALDWGQRICEDRTGLQATHYTTSGQDIFKTPLIPLSLTENCKKCIILGVLMVMGACHPYCHSNPISSKYFVGYPVLKQTYDPRRYKAVGIAAPLLKRKDFPVRSQEVLDELFGEATAKLDAPFIILSQASPVFDTLYAYTCTQRSRSYSFLLYDRIPYDVKQPSSSFELHIDSRGWIPEGMPDVHGLPAVLSDGGMAVIDEETNMKIYRALKACSTSFWYQDTPLEYLSMPGIDVTVDGKRSIGGLKSLFSRVVPN
ncbi:hypothetical protein BJV82DRAFT_709466 [Fennellomyces sp. T-0311]|nr:hypothetical protein BJV82DRAFT_709466 [Fennellomyces sp. T-0311]